MALLTVIGRGVRVRGRVTGEADLTIAGHVEGEVAVAGDVTIEAGGLVGANVSARSVVVRGAVKGDLTGEELVRLEDGARVVGDLRAPRIAIAQGALVRGLVQTGGAPSAPARARAETPAARPAARPAAPELARPAPSATAARPAAPSPPSTLAGRPTAIATPQAARAAANHAPAARKGPPPPVVPALKKGAKAALKKKAT